MSTRLPALIAYLVAEFQAAATLGQATPPVAIYDGPPVTGLDAPLKLYVGLTDPDNEAAEEAGTFDQSRIDLGMAAREENISIRCVAEAWSGTDDMATIRANAFGISAAVEALVRADGTFGAPQGTITANPGVTGGVLLQNATSTGAVARIVFSINFRAFS